MNMLKKLLDKNKNLFFSLAVTLSSLVLSYVLFRTKCFGNECGSTFIRGMLMPIFWFSTLFLPILSFFLFFSSEIYRRWLKQIAWWYLLLMLIAVLNTSIYSGSVLAMNRSEVVLWWVGFLTVITIPYVFITRRRLRDKK